MKIKICGQTRLEDIEYSFERGADFCGVVIEVPSSKRSMTIKKAKPLFEEPLMGKMVALTADADHSLYKEISDVLKPNAVQLTANETAEDIKKIKEKFGFKIFKSLHLPMEGGRASSPEKFLDKMKSYTDAGADAFILDTLVPEMHGGSGKKSDWKLAGKILLESRADTFLAGGIGLDNAKEAAELKPYGIDLASGVEISPGVKSWEKIDLLFTALGR